LPEPPEINLRDRVEEFDLRVGIAEISLAERLQHIDIVNRTQRLRDAATYTLLVIFALGSIATVVLFFLTGYGVTKLSDVAMGSLAATTVAETGGLLTIVVTGLFPQASA